MNLIKELLFPRRCPVCDGIVRQFGDKICLECRKKISYVSEPFCRKCGKPLDNTENPYCYDCRHREHEFDRGFALYRYDSISPAIYRFKYKGRREYADFFGEEIVTRLGEKILQMQADALIPVPIHKSRKRQRGYNQAALIARQVSRGLQIPVRDKLIVREKKTVPLKKLNPLERQNNLKKAFKLAQNDVKLDTIIIIDDIYTTGSTIDEISKEFRAVGVKNIFFITLSIGVGI